MGVPSPTSDGLRAALRAGIAIFNAGGYHAAHDAWEEYWLALEQGDPDERFLHGLIQFTAAIYHAERCNWDGATGLSTSALEYLAGLGGDYRDVSLEPVRRYLSHLANDPAVIERQSVPLLHYGGRPLTFEDLDEAETSIAAAVIAEEFDAFDPAVIEAAGAYVEGRRGERFRALLADFVRETDRRQVVYDRLHALVDRERQRERDVDGLFDNAD